MIMVLWTLAMLTMIGGYYAVEAKIRRNLGHNVMASLQGKYCVNAILEVVSSRIAKPENSDSSVAEEDSDEEEMFYADGTEYYIQFAGRDIQFTIEDESGKIDINKASEEDIRTVITYFIQDEEVANTMTDSILDWRDNDKLARASGAEDETYEELRPAYTAANGDFLLNQELLLVNGVTTTLFYGPVKWYGEDDQGDEILWEGGLIDLFTVYNGTDSVALEIAAPPIVAAKEENSSLNMETEPKGNFFQLLVTVDGLEYRIFWSRESGTDKYIIHEWQESPSA